MDCGAARLSVGSHRRRDPNSGTLGPGRHQYGLQQVPTADIYVFLSMQRGVEEDVDVGCGQLLYFGLVSSRCRFGGGCTRGGSIV
jgi:hypothetical protein